MHTISPALDLTLRGELSFCSYKVHNSYEVFGCTDVDDSWGQRESCTPYISQLFVTPDTGTTYSVSDSLNLNSCIDLTTSLLVSWRPTPGPTQQSHQTLHYHATLAYLPPHQPHLRLSEILPRPRHNRILHQSRPPSLLRHSPLHTSSTNRHIRLWPPSLRPLINHRSPLHTHRSRAYRADRG